MLHAYISISLLSAFLAYTLPIRFFPWRSFQSEWLVFCSFALVALSAARSGANEVSAPRSALLLLLIVLASAAIDLSVARLTFLGDGLLIVGYAVGVVVALSLGAQSSQRPRIANIDWAFPSFCVVLLLAGSVQAAIGIAQVLNPQIDSFYIIAVSPGDAREGRAIGNFGQPNHSGMLIAWAVLCGMYLWHSGRIGRLGLLLSLSLLIAGLAVMQSRSAVLGLLAACLLASLYWLARSARHQAMVWVALAVGSFAGFWAYKWISQTVLAAVPRALTQTANRSEAWMQLWLAVKQHWLFGRGWLSTAAAQDQMILTLPTEENFTYSHNLALDLALWFGLPVACLILLYVACAFCYSARRIANLEQAAGLSLLLPFGVQCLLEYPFAYAYFLIPAAFFWGLGCAPTLTRAIALSRNSVIALLGLAMGGLVLYGQQYLKAEAEITERRFYGARIGIHYTPPRNAEYLMMDQLRALADTYDELPKRWLSAEQLAIERATRMRFPYLPVMLRYAATLSINGKHTEALRQIHVMRAMFKPVWPAVHADFCAAATHLHPELGTTLAMDPSLACPFGP